MLVRREVILAKIESTYNTDPTPSASTDAIFVENPSWSHAGARMVERPSVKASLGKLKQLYGGTLKQLTFDCEIKGPGAAYSASVRPEVDVLLRICGLDVTVDTTPSSETATYAPVSSGMESATLYYYQDGTLQALTGCRGNVSFNAAAGSYGKFSFTITGHAAAPSDAALPTATYDSTVPPIYVNSAFTVDSYSATINALSFDMGNVLSMPGDVSASDGYGEVQIVDRDVAGSIDPLAVLVATHAFDSKWRSSASMALASGTIGATQYNKYAISMPAISYRDIAPGDRESLRTYDLSFGAAESTTDDEVSIVFS